MGVTFPAFASINLRSMFGFRNKNFSPSSTNIDLKREEYIELLAVLSRSHGWVGPSVNLDSLFIADSLFSERDMVRALTELKIQASAATVELSRFFVSCGVYLIHLPNGGLILAENQGPDHISIYNFNEKSWSSILRPKGRFRLLKIDRSFLFEELIQDRQLNWFFKTLKYLKGYCYQTGWISLLISALTLIMPFIVTLIFQQISAENFEITGVLLYGIAFYCLVIFALKVFRNQILSVFSARLGGLLGKEVLRRLLYMPPAFTEVASVGSQVTRLRDFDSIRSFFSSNVFVSLFEIPLLIILFVCLFWIGGNIALVPLVAVVVLFSSAIILHITQKFRISNVSGSLREKHDFLMEAGASFASIRDLGLESVWSKRFAEINSRALKESLTSQQRDIGTSIFSFAVVSCAGMGTMIVGAMQIMNGQLNSGELVASMMLTWRVLAPLRGLFTIATQVNQTFKSIQQVDNLMNMPIEKPLHSCVEQFSIKSGHVSFSQVSLRYASDAQPALLGVTYDLKPLETLVIYGHGGSGKSSVLKLLLGMYQAQTGVITIDGMNVKQLPQTVLRTKVAYLPEKPCLFPGSIRDNLKLINSELSEENLEIALGETGLGADLDRMGLNLDSILDDEAILRLGSSIIKRINLAQMFLRQSNLWLLDNPTAGLEPIYERQLLATLNAVHGSVSLIIATQDLRFTRFASQVMYLNNGRVAFLGKPKEFLDVFTKREK